MMKYQTVSSIQRKMFARAFATTAFTEFMQIVALTIDSLIVYSFLGEKEVAAVGLASPFFYLVGIPAACLGNGLQILCSRDMGRGKIDAVSRRFGGLISFTLISMSLFTLLVFLFIPQLALLFGAWGNAADLQDLISRYLYGLGIEVVPYVLQAVLIPIVILDNGNKKTMIAALVGGISNILFDILAIHFRWSLFGIGLGSSLSAIFSLIVLLSHFVGSKRIFRFRLKKPVWQDIRETIRTGQPNSFHALAGVFRTMGLNALVVQTCGNVYTVLAVLTLHGTLLDFIDILPVGIAGAVSILTGIAYGEHNGEEVLDTGIMAHRYIQIIGVISSSAAALGLPLFALLFPQLLDVRVTLILLAIGNLALGLIPGALIYSRVSYLQAITQEKQARLVDLVANLFFLLAFAFILTILFREYGLFTAFPLAKIATLLAIALYHKKKTGKAKLSPRDYTTLDSSFFSHPQDIIAYPVSTLKQSALASKQVRLFCKGHGLDARTAYLTGLCLEEAADSIIRRSKPKENDSVCDLRITITKEALIIRIRDSGEAFNLTEIAEMMAKEEKTVEYLGIKIICASAQETSYFRVYEMNTIILRILLLPSGSIVQS